MISIVFIFHKSYKGKYNYFEVSKMNLSTRLFAKYGIFMLVFKNKLYLLTNFPFSENVEHNMCTEK